MEAPPRMKLTMELSQIASAELSDHFSRSCGHKCDTLSGDESAIHRLHLQCFRSECGCACTCHAVRHRRIL